MKYRRVKLRLLRLRQQVCLRSTRDEGASFWSGFSWGGSVQHFVGVVKFTDKPSEEYRDLAGNIYAYVRDENGDERLTHIRKVAS